MLHTPSQIDTTEILRYLGYRGQDADAKTLALIEVCATQVLAAAVPHYTARELPLTFTDSCASLGSGVLLLPGGHLRGHLQGCGSAVIFAVTLSLGVDRLIARAQLSDMAAALVLDSAATALVESLADAVEQEIHAGSPAAFFTARYSPGYGDLPLATQSELLRVLDAPRQIGLTTSESQILTPLKSVTAIVGVSSEPLPQMPRGKCRLCTLRESCAFRRTGGSCNMG
jgi:5-methyltetrahydrofolate--homocysteine methyltransferase